MFEVDKLVFLLITLYPISTVGSAYPFRTTSGLYEEQLESPIFYDTFVPIIYNFQYPTWTNLDITLRDWRGLCQTDAFTPSYTCPVFFYLERFIERIQNEIINQSTKSSIQNISSPIPTIRNRCDKIQRHFRGLMITKAAFDQYVDSLVSCHVPGSFGIIKKMNQEYIYNIKYIYRMMVSKFEAEFATKTGSTDRLGPAYYVNQITASQGIMLFNYWVEHTRWENAVRTCSLQLIPTTLVKPGNLSEALNKLDEEVKQNKVYSLSIAANETSVYAISPLADCTLTDAGTFAVRILVPIKRRSFNPKLVKLQPVPFLLNDNQETFSVCQIFGLQGTYVYDEISGYLTESNCQPGALCQVENTANIPLPNLCASSYFASNLMDVKKHCSFECEKVVDHVNPRLPIIRRVASDIYIVTGNSNIEVVIKCEGKRDQIVNPDELGSLEIILPCQCSLNLRAEVFLPEQPCGQNLTITQIMPIQFFNEQFLSNNSDFGFNLSNFTGSFEKSMMESKLLNSASVSEAVGDASENTVSSDSQKLIVPQIDLESGTVLTATDEGSQVGTRGEAEARKSAAATGSESVSAVVWLWVLFIIQCCLFIIFVVLVSKRLGFFCYGTGFLFQDQSRLSFDNPLAQSSQTVGESSPSSKYDMQNGSHYEI